MSENRNCKQCGVDFVISDGDFAFYKKISPIFKDKTFEIPAPTLCPRCRNQRRLGVRNVINLYKRRCDLCRKDVISMYSPDKDTLKVYCSGCWWSDKWSHKDYALEYNPNKSFVEQVSQLKNSVPVPALMHAGSENSDYINLSNDNKNCYLVFLSGRNEDVYYAYWAEDSKSCTDVTYISFCELCYESINLGNCYNVNWSVNCGNCRDSYFIEDCASCSDCILCSCLSHKQFCYKNQQLTEEEYKKKRSEILENIETKLDDYKKEFQQIIISKAKKYSQMLRCENCSGDNIYDSKNCQACFKTSKSEDCKYCYDVVNAKDSMDVTGFGIPIELVYESQNIGLGSGRCAFISFAYQLADSYYSEHCYYSKNLFGCVGAKNHAEYCILNKQYQKDEYDKLVAEIIADMQKRGEWGEFFPANFSSFGYNETMANIYYPMTKEEAVKLGYFWQDISNDIEFSGTPYEPLPVVEYKKDETERRKILSSVLKCEKSGRPFKILPQELLFYIRNGIPIPRRHYAVRMMDRLSLINQNDLYHRQCMCEGDCKQHEGRCENYFKTTYPPEKPEKVFCERCYWGEDK